VCVGVGGGDVYVCPWVSVGVCVYVGGWGCVCVCEWVAVSRGRYRSSLLLLNENATLQRRIQQACEVFFHIVCLFVCSFV
jgi:hypothetical protein